MSTASFSRGAWARCWATTSSRPGPGDLVFKPRNQWHTFWNAGDEPCRILEIISPAGFERFFRELVDMGGVAQADEEAFAQLRERYGLEMRRRRFPSCLSASGCGWASRSSVLDSPRRSRRQLKSRLASGSHCEHPEERVSELKLST
jgi:hypothetical protein